jgi:hypothetical protein
MKDISVRLGMMQPYFFPYLGYFGLIHATDCWVVFDTPQYIRRGWVNRNRVLSTSATQWKYARVPVAKTLRSTAIRDVRIASMLDWKTDLLNQLDAYRLSEAPYYLQTVDFLRETLAFKTESLSELLTHCLKMCCVKLDIPFNCQIFSATHINLPQITDPGKWALETSRALGATEYINPPGGRILFDAEQFNNAGVTLKFLEPNLPPYSQGISNFVAGLSIIDVMMWNDIPAVRQMIANYQLTAA